MKINLIYEQTAQNYRLAVVGDGDLLELEFFNPAKANEGNIYLGKIIKKIELANGKLGYFLDIGDNRSAFINAEEKELEELIATEGQSIIVQVLQEQREEKGAKLTRALQFIGENLVYCPYRMDINISSKIDDRFRAEDLLSIVNDNSTGQEGWIIRTSATLATEDDIVEEMEYLRQLFDNILEQSKQVISPALLKEKNDCLKEAFLRNKKFINKIILNNHNMEKEYKDNADVEYCKNPFEEYGINEAMDIALQKETRLKGGGRIIIEETKAFVAIDVDSAEDNGTGNLGRLNIEAAFEIAKQIRLRNLSGKIIIDFAGISEYKYLKNVLEILEQELHKDYIKSTVLGLSKAGNVEIFRARRRPTLQSILTQECPTCHGIGRVEK